MTGPSSSRLATVWSAVKLGATAMSTSRTDDTPLRTSVASVTDSAIEPFSFQLPQKNARRVRAIGSSSTSFCLGSLLAGGLLLALSERRQAGQLLALQKLQRSTATGRDVGDLVGQAALVDGGDRIAPTDHGQSTGRPRHRFGDRHRAARERRRLEHAHGAVPEDGLGAGDRV